MQGRDGTLRFKGILESCMESYWDHLRCWTSVDAVDEGTAVLDLPYLDCRNDAIQVIVTRTGDGDLRLSDGEWTMTELEQSGCPIDNAGRRELLDTVLNVNGISESEGELYIVTDVPGFPHALEGLVAAMLRASEIRNIVYADWVQT